MSDDTYERLVPPTTRQFVSACIDHARGLMERDGAVMSIALVGSFGEEGEATIVPIGHLPKAFVAPLIKTCAKGFDADFVLKIDEAWVHATTSREEMERLKEQHGGEIRNIPGRRDVVQFALHTHSGRFIGIADRVAIAQEKDRYTFGDVDMEMWEIGGGRFADLLPARGTKQ